MKKLIPLSGGAGRAVLELEEKNGAVKALLTPKQTGEVWLVDASGRPMRDCASIADVSGALIIKEGTLAMSGGFAGRRALEGRALGEILLRGMWRETRVETPEAEPAAQAPTPEVETAVPPPEAPTEPNAAEGFVGRSEALLEILKKAKELFDGEAPQQPAPPAQEDGAIANPFPEAFPLSRWKRVAYPGTGRYYLEGETVKNGVEYLLHALPGEYRGGRRVRGFNSFYRARDGGGYWVRMTKKG